MKKNVLLLFLMLLLNSNLGWASVAKYTKDDLFRDWGLSQEAIKNNSQVNTRAVSNSKQKSVEKLRKERVPYSAAEQATIDYQQALQLWQRGDKVNACLGFHKVLAEFPAHVNARLQLIEYYQSVGDVNQLTELLQQGLALDNQQPIYIKQMALLLNNQAAYKRALSLLLTMPKQQQDDQEYKALLALTYLHEGIYDLAQKNYLQLLRLEPRNSSWRLGLAITQDALHDADEAMENFIIARNLGGLDSNTLAYIQQRIETLQQYHNTTRSS